jgi:hypothetical protein
VSIVVSHYRLGLPPWAPGWLHRIAPGDSGVWACALRSLLSDPEMAAVIVAVPRMRRILSPLCFMLKMEAQLLRPASPPAAPAPGMDTAASPCPPAPHDGSAQVLIEPAAAPPVTMARIPDIPGAIVFPV